MLVVAVDLREIVTVIAFFIAMLDGDAGVDR